MGWNTIGQFIEPTDDIVVTRQDAAHPHLLRLDKVTVHFAPEAWDRLWDVLETTRAGEMAQMQLVEDEQTFKAVERNAERLRLADLPHIKDIIREGE
jgi:hypothetical protein